MNKHTHNQNYAVSGHRYKKYIFNRRRKRICDIFCGLAEVLTIFVFPAVCIAFSADYNKHSERLYDRSIIAEDDYASTSESSSQISDVASGKAGNETSNITVNEASGKAANEAGVTAPVLADPVKGSDDNSKQSYPKQLLDMQEKYPETANFVAEYAEKKDIAPAGTVGEVKKGEIPLLIQWDERWGYQEYGDFIIGTDGCGPTSLSMVITGLTGDNTITPYRVACYAEKNGYYESGVGSKWTLMTDGAAYFGVTGIELPLYKESVYSALEAGMPVICSVGAGDFTTNGHFIVLVGISDGKIIVNDPNSRVNSSKLWEYGRLEEQIINLWAYVAQ